MSDEVVVTEQAPLLDDAIPVRIDREITLGKFQHELEQATGKPVTLALQGPDRHDVGVSLENLQTLWVRPKSITASQVLVVLDKHVIDPDWGVPAFNKNFNALVAKVMDDPEAKLTAAEVKTLVVGVVLRQQMHEMVAGR